MKRPLEAPPVINPEQKDAMVTQVCPVWYERLALQFYMATRHVLNLPVQVMHLNTEDPYLTFKNRDEIMERLDLTKVTPHLARDQNLRYPVTAPDIDPTTHFAQWGVVWEPVTNDLCATRTLKVEVGAGFCLLSLTFTPLAADTDSKQMQLDEITLQYGHDAYDIPVGRENGVYDSEAARHVTQLFAAARATIELIHDEYPLAETTLHNATRPIFDLMQEREREYLRQEQAETAQTGGNPGFPTPQTP